MSVRSKESIECECSRAESGDLRVPRRVVGSVGWQHGKQCVDGGPLRLRVGERVV